MGVIYKIQSPSNRIYIGKTVNLKDRLRKYRNNKTNNQRLLHNSIRKYGWENHEFKILFYADDDELIELEREMIKGFRSYHGINEMGLNLTLGGEGNVGMVHSDKTKKTLSDKAKLRTHTKETREKISKSGKGRIQSLEARLKSSISQLGSKNHRYGTGIPILVYDIKGDFVAEFISAKRAAEFIKCFRTSVTSVCRGKAQTIKKYICKYKTENYPLKLNLDGYFKGHYKYLNSQLKTA